MLLSPILLLQVSQTVTADIILSDGTDEVFRQVTINVGDVNDELPYFDKETYKATVSEVRNNFMGDFFKPDSLLCK